MSFQELLEKFHRGEASPEELQSLYVLIKNGRHPGLMAMIDEEWDAMKEGDVYDRSEDLLKEIHIKAGMHEPARQGVIRIRKILQYAAVFILAFGLSWLLKSFPESQPVASVEPPAFFNITVPYGSKTTIELPDHSKVILNSGSTLKYPDRFEENDRTVFLHGEAYFDVQRNKKKPFFVKTEDATIKVLGTQFNVKAYPEEKIMETTLVSGSVEIVPNKQVINDTKQEYTRILLKPNEKAVLTQHGITTSGVRESIKKSIENTTLTATITTQKEDKTQTDIAWKNDILILSNEPFFEIVHKLERWYNVEIAMNSEELAHIRFSARFKGESISEVLEALSMAQPFYYEINKNKIKILTRKTKN